MHSLLFQAHASNDLRWLRKWYTQGKANLTCPMCLIVDYSCFSVVHRFSIICWISMITHYICAQGGWRWVFRSWTAIPELFLSPLIPHLLLICPPQPSSCVELVCLHCSFKQWLWLQGGLPLQVDLRSLFWGGWSLDPSCCQCRVLCSPLGWWECWQWAHGCLWTVHHHPDTAAVVCLFVPMRVILLDSSLCISTFFAKSHIFSNMIPHSKGQGAPPNVSWSLMVVIALSGSCVAVFKAISKWGLP